MSQVKVEEMVALVFPEKDLGSRYDMHNGTTWWSGSGHKYDSVCMYRLGTKVQRISSRLWMSESSFLRRC